MQMTVFLMLWASPGWLKLDRGDRARIAGAAMEHAFSHPGVTLRHFDAEAFHGRVSDVAMVSAARPEDFYFAMERLRDTPLITEGYFQVVDVIPAYEDGFRRFEEAENAA